MFTIGVSSCAAPGGGESSCVGAGIVHHSLVDEGELAGGGAGGGGGGGGGGWHGAPAGITVSVVTQNMFPISISLGGTPGWLEASSIGAAGVGDSL